MTEFERHLARLPAIAILRGITEDEVLGIAEAILDAGISLIEIPLNSPNAVRSIGLLKQHFSERGLFGCGTCVTLEQAQAVADVGGQLMVTPNTNPAIITRAVQLGMIPVPGWATVSEAYAAYEAGARYLKLFPAATYGVAHLRAASAVLPTDAHIIAVGGVGAANAAQWFEAGVKGIGIGSELYRAGRSRDDVAARAQDIASAIKHCISTGAA